MNYVYVLGSKILSAAIAGAKCGYNRSTDDMEVYVNRLSESRIYWLKKISRNGRRKIKQVQAKFSPRKKILNTVYPVSLLMVHEHKQGKSCEPHARILLYPSTVIDIPMHCWEEMEAVQTPFS